MKNYHLKILALCGSVILWLFVVGVQNKIQLLPFDFEVKIIGLEQNVSLAGIPPKVKIRVKTEPDLIGQINRNDFEVFVDATNLSSGYHKLNVQSRSLNNKYAVVNIEPESIELDLEAVASKEIPVEVRLSGSPAFGFEVKSSEPIPKTVKLNGPASQISSVTKAIAKVSLNGFESAEVIRSTKPEIIDTTVSGTTKLSPELIEVKIQITAKPNQPTPTQPATPNITPDSPTSPPSNYPQIITQTLPATITVPQTEIFGLKEILPKTVNLTLRGDKTILDQLQSRKITVIIDTNKINQGSYKLSREDFDIPSTVEITSINPEQITVRY